MQDSIISNKCLGKSPAQSLRNISDHGGAKVSSGSMEEGEFEGGGSKALEGRGSANKTSVKKVPLLLTNYST